MKALTLLTVALCVGSTAWAVPQKSASRTGRDSRTAEKRDPVRDRSQEPGEVSVEEYEKYRTSPGAPGSSSGSSTSTAEAPSAYEDVTDQKRRRFNLRINPLGLVARTLSADLDIGIVDGLTLGPTFAKSGFSLFNMGFDIQAYGLRANYSFNRRHISSSWYGSLMGSVGPGNVKFRDAASDFTGMAIVAMAGHQWVWSQGININLGAGMGYYGATTSVDLKTPGGQSLPLPIPGLGGILPAVEFGVGFAI